MTILLLILKAICIMVVAIAFACVICMGLYAFLKHFGYFDTPAPSKTSELIDDYPASEDFRMLCEQRARERGM